MADALYPIGKAAILSGGIQWKSGGHNFKVSLIDTGVYTYSAAHDFYDDLSGVIDTSGNLASLTYALGQADAADITLPAVTIGDTVGAIVIWRDSTVAGTSELIAYIDSAVGLPLETNNGDILIQWDTYIFAL